MVDSPHSARRLGLGLSVRKALRVSEGRLVSWHKHPFVEVSIPFRDVASAWL